MKRTTVYKELFSSDLEDNNILLSTEDYMNKLFDEPNDYRWHSWEVATGRQTSDRRSRHAAFPFSIYLKKSLIQNIALILFSVSFASSSFSKLLSIK